MTSIMLKVTGAEARATVNGVLTAGMVGIPVTIEYDDAWNGLVKNLVCRCGRWGSDSGETRTILNVDQSALVAHEVMQANRTLYLGVEGYNADGTLVMPTTWAKCDEIKHGANTDADPSASPTLSVWGQLQREIEQLKHSSATSDQIVEVIEDYLKEHPVEVPDVLPNLELDTTLTVAGKAADAAAAGARLTALEQLGGITVIEPAEDDIPRVFFGGPLQQTKDEAVVPFRYISKTQDFSGYAEIKAQGNSSMGYPKKNQTVKMFKDADCTEKLKVDFKGWGKQNKHCYKANWIDLSHARNVVSARLWADIVKSRSNYSELPELLRSSPNQGAVDGFPIRVYAEGLYQGRYTLNIPKDKWMFNMDDELDEHCVLCGEGFTSGCFRAANMGEWTDEIHDTCPESIKSRWIEVIEFVMNSTDEEFRTNLHNYFDVPSLIDYDLFALAHCGIDAYGKNQLYVTYDGQKWYASMYDMDATWGLYWNGGFFNDADLSRDLFEDRKGDREGNLLYIRLEQCFAEELKTRWEALKAGALSIENVINRFEQFTDIASGELVAEDYASTTGGGAFTGIPSKTTNNIQQIRAFALDRQKWLDEYMFPVPCTGVTLSTNTLIFTAEGTKTLTATVTPENTTDVVIWESDNTSIATVADGVVTAVANGSATISATCGGYAAICSVLVSGIAVPVPCTGVTLSDTSIELHVDSATGTQGVCKLTATVTPEDTTDTLTWSSSAPDVAAVKNGVVTAVSEGSATITAKCGSCSAACAVTVSVTEADPLYPLENGTFVKTSAGTTATLTTSESGHVSLNYDVEGWGASLPIDNIVSITAATNNAARTEPIFTIPAGSSFMMRVRNITISEDMTGTETTQMFNVSLLDASNKEHKSFLSNVQWGALGITELDGTVVTLDEDLAVYSVNLWQSKFAGTVEFDFKLYVDGVRWI